MCDVFQNPKAENQHYKLLLELVLFVQFIDGVDATLKTFSTFMNENTLFGSIFSHLVQETVFFWFWNGKLNAFLSNKSHSHNIFQKTIIVFRVDICKLASNLSVVYPFCVYQLS